MNPDKIISAIMAALEFLLSRHDTAEHDQQQADKIRADLEEARDEFAAFLNEQQQQRDIHLSAVTQKAVRESVLQQSESAQQSAQQTAQEETK